MTRKPRYTMHYALASRWREIKYQSIGALGAVVAIKHVSPRDYHGSFDPLTLHKRCRYTLEFRASDYYCGMTKATGISPATPHGWACAAAVELGRTYHVPSLGRHTAKSVRPSPS